jgi:hypothetical protein
MTHIGHTANIKKKHDQLRHLTELSELPAVQPPSCLESCIVEMHRCCLCTGHQATEKKNVIMITNLDCLNIGVTAHLKHYQ